MSNKSEKRLERHPLPKTIDGICALVRRTLKEGGIARLEMDVDDTLVRTWRWVERDDLEEQNEGWDSALRNVPTMLEYASPGATPFQVLVDMMILGQKEGPHGVAWAAGRGGRNLIRRWLELVEREIPVEYIEQLLDLPLLELSSLPEDTLLLCCSKYRNAEPSEVTVVIKTAIELRKVDGKVNEDADRSGGHPEEHAPADGTLALSTRGLRRVTWKENSPSGPRQPNIG